MSGQVFISYSSVDRAYVQRLADLLKANGIRVWFDPQIGPGERFAQVIEREITGSAVMIVVMSRAAAASKWVPREMEWADRQSKPVLPLLLDGDVFFEYANTQYVDVRGGQLPPPYFVDEARRLAGGVASQAPIAYPMTPRPAPPAAVAPPRSRGARAPAIIATALVGILALCGLGVFVVIHWVVGLPGGSTGSSTSTRPHGGQTRTDPSSAPPTTAPAVERLARPASATSYDATFTITSIATQADRITITIKAENGSSQPLSMWSCCIMVEQPSGRQRARGPFNSGTFPGGPDQPVPARTTITGTVFIDGGGFEPGTTSVTITLEVYYRDERGIISVQFSRVALLKAGS